jgi:hypothetical protein
MSMDADVKAKWLEALRSGKYTQTRSYLKDSRGYCCLGVLCEIQDVEYEPGLDSEGAYRFDFRSFSENESQLDVRNNFPTEDFLESVGLRSLFASDLAVYNDEGYSFEYIANWIEKEA